jgi:hypothetical protein
MPRELSETVLAARALARAGLKGVRVRDVRRDGTATAVLFTMTGELFTARFAGDTLDRLEYHSRPSATA